MRLRTGQQHVRNSAAVVPHGNGSRRSTGEATTRRDGRGEPAGTMRAARCSLARVHGIRTRCPEDGAGRERGEARERTARPPRSASSPGLRRACMQAPEPGVTCVHCAPWGIAHAKYRASQRRGCLNTTARASANQVCHLGSQKNFFHSLPHGHDNGPVHQSQQLVFIREGNSRLATHTVGVVFLFVSLLCGVFLY